ncbi:MAG TPA: hypothetical protein VGX48_00075 [Pyrinomonadaceae bacterium]|nr:hypothetical protein [Pyrinomonadaceae bacterium]
MRRASKGSRTLSERVYAALLVAYPAGFRREYGREMRRLFADRRREAARPLALPRLWCETLADLLKTAPVEHLDSLTKGEGMKRTLRTVAVAVTAYAFTLLVVAPLFARNVGTMPGFVSNLLDALISTGLVFNFVYLVLTLPRWLEGPRAVRAALVITTAVVGLLITLMMMSGGPHARVNLLIIVAQILALLVWFTLHLWWVLRRRAAGPPAAA